jgi:hypothetical protein
MYYYSHKRDVRPKGVIFLTGSIVERVSTYARAHVCTYLICKVYWIPALILFSFVTSHNIFNPLVSYLTLSPLFYFIFHLDYFYPPPHCIILYPTATNHAYLYMSMSHVYCHRLLPLGEGRSLSHEGLLRIRTPASRPLHWRASSVRSTHAILCHSLLLL